MAACAAGRWRSCRFSLRSRCASTALPILAPIILFLYHSLPAPQPFSLRSEISHPAPSPVSPAPQPLPVRTATVASPRSNCRLYSPRAATNLPPNPPEHSRRLRRSCHTHTSRASRAKTSPLPSSSYSPPLLPTPPPPQVLYPQRVWLIRGNHEFREQVRERGYGKRERGGKRVDAAFPFFPSSFPFRSLFSLSPFALSLRILHPLSPFAPPLAPCFSLSALSRPCGSTSHG